MNYLLSAVSCTLAALPPFSHLVPLWSRSTLKTNPLHKTHVFTWFRTIWIQMCAVHVVNKKISQNICVSLSPTLFLPCQFRSVFLVLAKASALFRAHPADEVARVRRPFALPQRESRLALRASSPRHRFPYPRAPRTPTPTRRAVDALVCGPSPPFPRRCSAPTLHRARARVRQDS